VGSATPRLRRNYNALRIAHNMFERYRQDARRAIFFARWEAQQSGSVYIEPEHLLLGLTHDADSKANQLFALFSHTDDFRSQFRPHPPTKTSTSVDFPLSNAGKRVLAYAAQETDRLASKPIGTEHLLLGLLREKKSDVPEALAALGINLHSARNRIREAQGVPILDHEPDDNETSLTPDREPDDKETSHSPLRPFAVFVLLILVLLLIYAIFRLVNK
jgi:ATP-dependent Clp protease ATP-binding subunit ClpC